MSTLTPSPQENCSRCVHYRKDTEPGQWCCIHQIDELRAMGVVPNDGTAKAEESICEDFEPP
jgi:hypothetical protein